MQLGQDQLAIEGGRPVRAAPFQPWPVFEQDEIDAAVAVLASGRVNYWTGNECRRFEQDFAAFCGTRHAISLANGTLALELALHALGIGPGDEVIVPARTFIASASCAVARGAVPVVADVDPVSQNLTADTVLAALTCRTRAIVAVHLAGWPCDMDPIMALARRRGIKVVEDCAQAHGATYKGRPVGSLGDCAAFSFCQDKIMTTGGEGGMLVMNDTPCGRRPGPTRTTARATTRFSIARTQPGSAGCTNRSAAISA
jgi:dTDP-4-amino-4,6-dideoxygalactose transaminase